MSLPTTTESRSQESQKTAKLLDLSDIRVSTLNRRQIKNTFLLFMGHKLNKLDLSDIRFYCEDNFKFANLFVSTSMNDLETIKNVLETLLKIVESNELLECETDRKLCHKDYIRKCRDILKLSVDQILKDEELKHTVFVITSNMKCAFLNRLFQTHPVNDIVDAMEDISVDIFTLIRTQYCRNPHKDHLPALSERPYSNLIVTLRQKIDGLLNSNTIESKESLSKLQSILRKSCKSVSELPLDDMTQKIDEVNKVRYDSLENYHTASEEDRKDDVLNTIKVVCYGAMLDRQREYNNICKDIYIDLEQLLNRSSSH